MKLQATCVTVCAVLAVWALHVSEGMNTVREVTEGLSISDMSDEQLVILAKMSGLEDVAEDTVKMCALLRNPTTDSIGPHCREILEHMEDYAKTLVFDFFSAFNTSGSGRCIVRNHCFYL